MEQVVSVQLLVLPLLASQRQSQLDKQEQVQGVSKKRYFSDFLSYFSSRGRILLFHVCFGIRILRPFHLVTQIISIQNINCPKNAETHAHT